MNQAETHSHASELVHDALQRLEELLHAILFVLASTDQDDFQPRLGVKGADRSLADLYDELFEVVESRFGFGRVAASTKVINRFQQMLRPLSRQAGAARDAVLSGITCLHAA